MPVPAFSARPGEPGADRRPARRAAILAGGASARMGTPKATLELWGKPLIAHPLDAALHAGLAPFVVARHDSELPPLDCPIVHDAPGPRHPLSGIVAALEEAREPLVIVACDVPLVPPGLLAELAGRPSAVAIPVAPRPQPLVARYAPSVLPRLRAAQEANGPLGALVLELDAERLDADELGRFGDPERMFANANDPAQLERIAAAS